jgi:hypothetical protein
MIKFEEKGHKYTNVDPKDDFQWVSVTKLVGQFKEKFDAPKVAERCSKGKNPKYKGKPVEEILEMWDRERDRSTDLGSWYHNQRERDMLQFKTITRDGIELPIVKPTVDKAVKFAQSQKIEAGVYPELLVYLRSANICGQADKIEIINSTVNVYDFKTNKEVKREGYTFYDGSKKMMLGPVRHLEDCEFNHYALQLSIYMYVICKHNYNYTPGQIQIQHVQFKKEKDDENGFPIYELDAGGEPIIENIDYIDLPYLKSEVISMLKWLKAHKKMVLKDEC